MANDITVMGARYGGLPPAGTINADGFAAHDATQAWTDGGAGDVLAQDIFAYGAEQAKQAILEYATTAHGDLDEIEGELCFVIDNSNNLAPFGSYYNMGNHSDKGLAEASQAEDQEKALRFVAALRAYHRRLGAALEKYFPEQQQYAATAPRALRPGAVRPAPKASNVRPNQRPGRLPPPRSA